MGRVTALQRTRSTDTSEGVRPSSGEQFPERELWNIRALLVRLGTPGEPDLVVARRLQLAQLQPVQRRLAGDRRAIAAPRRELARQYRHHRVVPQFIVVVEILVAERDPEYPLTDQGRDLMFDVFGAPLVVKAQRNPVHHSIARSVAPSSSAPASEVVIRERCGSRAIRRRSGGEISVWLMARKGCCSPLDTWSYTCGLLGLPGLSPDEGQCSTLTSGDG
jgi:hypothetical protein